MRFRMQNSLQLIIFILVITSFPCAHSVCEITSGSSAVILEIQESQGDQISQKTKPDVIQVTGNENEIELRIESGSHDYFTIQGKRLILTKPLDRDETGLSSIRLIVSCKGQGVSKQFPVVVLVVDINDNSPVFTSSQYTTVVPELSPIGTTVFRDLKVTDKDAGSNSLVEFTTIPGDGTQSDGYRVFSINLPHQGFVTVSKSLDYEKIKKYYLTIKASDKAVVAAERLTATTTLTINISDDDDLDPTFIYQGCTTINDACVNVEYSASVTSSILTGLLTLSPENIRAKDRDSIDAPVQYSFVNGTPSNYAEIFSIDRTTGSVTQNRAVDRSAARQFNIIVKVEEETDARRLATAKLTVDVQAIDRNPPVIIPSSVEGYVDENADVGTTVVTQRGGQTPVRFRVTDADIAVGDAVPSYVFELTSNAFRVNSDGYLIVNLPNLDRDPPNPGVFTFQVIAREVNARSGKGASAPISITVTLNDINDNAPQLPSFSPVTIQAGKNSRTIARVEARDNDAGEFAKIRYSIHHVSNSGFGKFQINQDNGELQAIGALAAGEQYSITIQATDVGRKFSQSIVDVLVSPGPNIGGPVFTQNVYNIQISEGASVNSAVITVTARDPENDAVTYSIVDGNMKNHFVIDQRSGVIRVAKQLDREVVSSYTLIVQASDESNLYTTVRVNIELTDINDRNPEFLQPFYIFSIEEGLADTVIGSVQARDDDSASNAEIMYSVPSHSGFSIDPIAGVIKTKIALDYEKQKIHYVVVTAKDRAQDPRIATATVTVSVLDIQDEVPTFERRFYEGTVPENEPNFEVVQVKAKDPDTVSSITYIIKMGPPDVFSVDPISGVVRTLIPIDFEKQSRFELIIGTVENVSPNDPMSTCTVLINVQDRNDIPPVFTGILQPIRLHDTVPLGTTVTTVIATDGDASAPGNQVKYRISGRGKAPKYFFIDGDTGIISVKDDLRKEPDTQYQIEVRAYDLGIPPLMDTVMVTVFIDHVSALPPDIRLGLSDSKYTVEVRENSPINTVVKILKVINKPPGNMPVRCQITDGNIDDTFYVLSDENRDCILRTNKNTLDFEKVRKYLLTVQISAPGIPANSPKMVAMVAVNILDENDNPPFFIIPSTYARMTNTRFLAVASKDTPTFSPIIQITAKDDDSEANGKIRYELLKESDPDDFFLVDPETGFVSNKRAFVNVKERELPFKITIVGQDLPESNGRSLSAETQLIVNLVEDKSRMILVVHGMSPDKFNSKKDKLIGIIQAHTGMIVGIEKMETKKMIVNSTIQTDPLSSDIWFYAIDPTTLTIVDRTSTNLKSSIMAKDSRGVLLSKISTLLNVRADEIRPPLVKPIIKTSGVGPLKPNDDLDSFQAALIALAGIILVLGIIAIIYLCFLWSRYVTYRERMKRLYVIPKYEPVLVEPSMKEYETQVLQMSVPQDDDGSVSDLNVTQISSSKSIENVSYITKDQTGSAFGTSASFTDRGFSEAAEPSPKDNLMVGGVRASSVATTARASSLESGPSTHSSNLMVYESEIGLTPTQNPLFEDKYSSDEESYSSVNRKQRTNKSSFGKPLQYSYDRSAAESTTEL